MRDFKLFDKNQDYVIYDNQCMIKSEIVATAKFVSRISGFGEIDYPNVFVATRIGNDKPYLVHFDDYGSQGGFFTVKENPKKWFINVYWDYSKNMPVVEEYSDENTQIPDYGNRKFIRSIEIEKP